MTHALHNVVYARLDAIANAEKITRAELGALSRELLVYVPDTHDIDIVNRLLVVLTPVNRRAAILYFQHFLPWQAENDKDGKFQRFGKMLKGERQVKLRMDAIAAWLANEANNLWSWSDDNIEMKPKDLGGSVTKAIERALKGDDKTGTPALSHMDVMKAVFDGGITLADLLAVIDTITSPDDNAANDNAEGEAPALQEVA